MYGSFLNHSCSIKMEEGRELLSTLADRKQSPSAETGIAGIT